MCKTVKRGWTLRRLIPAMVVVAGAAVIASQYGVSLNYAEESVRKKTADRIQSIGGQLAVMSDYLLSNDQDEALTTAVESLATLPDLRVAMVMDASTVIVASTQTEEIGRRVSDTGWGALWSSVKEQPPTHSETHTRATLRLWLDEAKYSSYIAGVLDTVEPSLSGTDSVATSSTEHGTVLIALNTIETLAAEQQHVRLVALVSGILVILVAVLFWYGMHRLVSRPVSQLADTSRTLTTGHYDVSTHLHPVNELAEISTALDSLAIKAQEGEEIKVLNDRLVEIVEHSLNEVYVVDADNYRILSANRVARERHGLGDVLVTPLQLWDLLPAIDADALRTLLQPLKSGELSKKTLESDLTSTNGMTYAVELTLQLLSSGPAPVILVVAKDIQELKLQQQDLQLRNQAMDAVDVGISITDARLTGHPLVYVNEGWCKMTGYDHDELIGKPVRHLQRSDVHQPAHTKIEQAQERGESVQVLLTSTRKDGSTYSDELFLSPIKTMDGQLTHYIGVNRDVTSLLETQRQLDNAQRLESVGLLSGGIAHDFNNLLSVIQGNLEFLTLQLTDEEQLELVRDATGAVNMGSRLTKRLLAFGRRSQLEPATLNLNTQVLEAVELLRSAVGETITLSTSLAVDLGSIYSDRSQLENAIVNLTLNARDALESGGRILINTGNVTVHSDEPMDIPSMTSGDYVCLQVTDTGCGMTAEVKARVLEPFFSTKAPGEGTGLGLSTIYGFVRQSGGYLHIESEPGEGTTISLYFPRYESSVGSVGTESINESVQLGNTQPMARILIVDDNDSVRKVTLRRLAALGYRTCSASNSVNAMEQLDEAATSGHGFDLVLTDIVMDTAHAGYDLAHWVEAHYPQCSVLLTSAYFDRRPDETLSVPFLQKPYALDELRQAVVGALGSSEA